MTLCKDQMLRSCSHSVREISYLAFGAAGVCAEGHMQVVQEKRVCLRILRA